MCGHPKTDLPSQPTAVTIRRRVPVGLEEREGGTQVERMEGAGNIGSETQGAQEFKLGSAGILQSTQPKPFMLFVKSFQPVQERRIQAETAAYFGDGFPMGKKGKESLYQVFQGQLAVGDNEIRQDGVGMAAAAHHAHDTDPCAMGLALPEIQDVAAIIRMDMAAAFAFAAWAGLHLRTESCHIFPEAVF